MNVRILTNMWLCPIGFISSAAYLIFGCLAQMDLLWKGKIVTHGLYEKESTCNDLGP